MLQRPITNYRLKKSPTLRKKNTTFMLGSRCSDGESLYQIENLHRPIW